jgi:hypothetical protein
MAVADGVLGWSRGSVAIVVILVAGSDAPYSR